jgi:hypothetical protein
VFFNLEKYWVRLVSRETGKTFVQQLTESDNRSWMPDEIIAEQYFLTHKNPYTGTTYAEEPAVAFVEINNENSLISNWKIRNSSMVTDKQTGTLSWFAQHRIAGMPLTISEYDHPAPTFFCAEMFPMLNSFAAFQDFDGIYHFTFDAPYDGGRIDNFFSSAGHPLKQIFVPVGAVLFRMGAVQPGKHTVLLDLPPSAVLENMVKTGDKIRLHVSNMKYVWEAAGASPALSIIHPVNVNVKASEFRLSEPVTPTNGPWESETGEIIWDNRDSINAVYRINSPSAKAAIGYIGGKSIDLGNVTIAMDTTQYKTLWYIITR